MSDEPDFRADLFRIDPRLRTVRPPDAVDPTPWPSTPPEPSVPAASPVSTPPTAWPSTGTDAV